jgi:anti-sigma factor RsiW
MTIPSLADLSCQQFVELATAYLTGTMPEEDRLGFEQHVFACPWCMTYLDQMRCSISLTRQLQEGEVTSETKAKLGDLFRSWRGQ